MLKRVFSLALLFCLTVLLCGCDPRTLIDRAEDIRDSVGQYTADFLAQSTVTMPVLPTLLPTITPTFTETVPPTETPVPSATPTHEPTVYMTPTFVSVDLSTLPETTSEKLEVLSDVTFPDNSVLEPGEIFVKVFRLKNVGASAWTQGMQLSTKSNGELNTPQITTAVFLQPRDLIEVSAGTWGLRKYSVTPGETADLAVLLQAPRQKGSYQIDFRLIMPDGVMIHTPFWMRFIVDGPEPTETPTPEPVIEPAEGETAVPTKTPIPAPYDWNGVWAIRNPYADKGLDPIPAWIREDGDLLTGFFFDASGEPVLISGSLFEKGRILKGDFACPWMSTRTTMVWEMSESRDQFVTVNIDGEIHTGTICGAKGEAFFPEACARPETAP